MKSKTTTVTKTKRVKKEEQPQEQATPIKIHPQDKKAAGRIVISGLQGLRVRPEPECAVRRNRDEGKWAVTDGNGETVDHCTFLLLVDVVFEVWEEEYEKEERYVGCGRYEGGGSGTRKAGKARGKVMSALPAKSIPKEAKPLKFHPDHGFHTYTKDKMQKVTACDMLYMDNSGNAHAMGVKLEGKK